MTQRIQLQQVTTHNLFVSSYITFIAFLFLMSDLNRNSDIENGDQDEIKALNSQESFKLEKFDSSSQPSAFPELDSEPLGARPAYAFPVGDVTCWRRTTSITSFFELTWSWLLTNKAQILSGITVALAQVPEAVSFSFVAGVEPAVGLQSAWIMGIITSLCGGRPGMIAGSTGA
jgi:hypothetical protein